MVAKYGVLCLDCLQYCVVHQSLVFHVNVPSCSHIRVWWCLRSRCDRLHKECALVVELRSSRFGLFEWLVSVFACIVLELRIR